MSWTYPGEEDRSFWANPRRRAARDEILRRMKNGQRFEKACRTAGIDPATGWRWRQRDLDFRNSVIMLRFLRTAGPRVEQLMIEGQYLLDAAGIPTD